MTIATFRTSPINGPANATNVVDATDGPLTLVLDLASSTAPNTRITVIKKDATANAVTVQDAAATVLATLDSENDSIDLFCDGVKWSSAEAEAAIGTKLNLGVFGDGLDGDRVITTAQVASNNLFYRNLRIDAGGSLDMGGWALFVSNLLTVNGTLGYDGADGEAGADGGAAGAGAAREYLAGSNAGGAGSTTNGAAGAAVTDGIGTVGGQGGAGVPGTGGSAGSVTILADARGGARVIHQAIPAITGESQGVALEGSSGGGGGGGDGVKKGGGGGASGGYAMIAARAITGTGTISAAGGDGGPGDPAGDTGGGGGGAGGILVVISESGVPATVTTDVGGGIGGALGGGGAAGDNGEDGVYVNLYGVK